jgi:hypothetical protein
MFDERWANDDRAQKGQERNFEEARRVHSIERYMVRLTTQYFGREHMKKAIYPHEL